MSDQKFRRGQKFRLTPGPKEKRRILPESTPALQIRGHLWCVHGVVKSEISQVRNFAWHRSQNFVKTEPEPESLFNFSRSLVSVR